MELFINLVVAHLIADWIFQNHWIAINKTNIKHPALYVHGAIHFVVMFLLGLTVTRDHTYIVLAIACIHMAIDTRKPLLWWMKTYKQTTDGDYAIHVQIWLDQVFHIVTIYIITVIM